MLNNNWKSDKLYNKMQNTYRVIFVSGKQNGRSTDHKIAVC